MQNLLLFRELMSLPLSRTSLYTNRLIDYKLKHNALYLLSSHFIINFSVFHVCFLFETPPKFRNLSNIQVTSVIRVPEGKDEQMFFVVIYPGH